MSLLIPEQLKGCLIDFYFDVYIVPLISEILDSEKKKKSWWMKSSKTNRLMAVKWCKNKKNWNE